MFDEFALVGLARLGPRLRSLILHDPAGLGAWTDLPPTLSRLTFLVRLKTNV